MCLHFSREQNGSFEKRFDKNPDYTVPILGSSVNYGDLKFLERLVVDTVDIMKAWKKKYERNDNEY